MYTEILKTLAVYFAATLKQFPANKNHILPVIPTCS